MTSPPVQCPLTIEHHGQDGADGEDTMGELKFQLLHYLSELWKRRWSILAVTGIVGLVGAFFAASAKDVYTSRATVFVDTTSLMQKIVGRELNISDPAAVIENVRKSMYARPNIEEVIRRTDLDLTLNDKRDWETLVSTLSEDMILKRQGQDFYNIEFSSGKPERARDVVQALLDLFLEEGLIRSGVDSSDSESVRRYVETQLKESSARLAEVEAKIAEHERQYRDELSGAPAVASEKRGIEAQLSQLEGDRLLYQQELSSLRSRLAGTPPQVLERVVQQPQAQRPYIPPPTGARMPIPQGPTLEEQQLQAFQAQASAVQGEVNQLLQRLTPQHPDVAAAQARAANVQAQLSQMQAAAQAASAALQQRIQAAIAHNAQIDAEYRQWQIESNRPVEQTPPREIYGPNPAIADLRLQIDQRRNRLTVTEAKIAELRNDIPQLQATLARQPEILQNYKKLESERGKYAAETERHRARLEKLIAIGDPNRQNLVEFRVIEPPQVSVTPAGPNRLILFLGAGLMAVGAGVGAAFMRIQMADNMPTISHMKNSFDLPVLGGISMIGTAGQRTRTLAGNLAYLAIVAALVTIFAWVTYRYHVSLWRPNVGGALQSIRGLFG